MLDFSGSQLAEGISQRLIYDGSQHHSDPVSRGHIGISLATALDITTDEVSSKIK